MRGDTDMGIFSTPSVETPPPPPTLETAATDDDMKARTDIRKKMMGAVNSRSTILSQQNSGQKTLLGQ